MFWPIGPMGQINCGVFGTLSDMLYALRELCLCLSESLVRDFALIHHFLYKIILSRPRENKGEWFGIHPAKFDNFKDEKKTE